MLSDVFGWHPRLTFDAATFWARRPRNQEAAGDNRLYNLLSFCLNFPAEDLESLLNLGETGLKFYGKDAGGFGRNCVCSCNNLQFALPGGRAGDSSRNSFIVGHKHQDGENTFRRAIGRIVRCAVGHANDSGGGFATRRDGWDFLFIGPSQLAASPSGHSADPRLEYKFGFGCELLPA